MFEVFVPALYNHTNKFNLNQRWYVHITSSLHFHILKLRLNIY